VSYGWDPDKHFFVPEDALRHFREAVPAGQKLVAEWNALLERYAAQYPAEAAELRRRLARELPTGWDAGLKVYGPADGAATRKASQEAIQALAKTLPELFGGAADLSESNLTDVEGAGIMSADNPGGRNIRFGVREHAMGAAANGISLYGGFIPYAGTFLTFSDYMRGAVRLAALSKLRVIYVWTHDSIGLGEDGPTHQPVEHAAALRAIPNLTVMRPGDPNETVAAWACAIDTCDGPTALLLTRQKLPVLAGTAEKARAGVARGGYVLRDSEGKGGAARPDLILIGTGSELQLAVAAAEVLEKDGIGCRVVSLPSWELFEAQDAAYRESVLPRACHRRVSVEAGVTLGWERYAGDEGVVMGIERFGASAPAEKIFEAFGLTGAHVAEVGRKVVRDGLHGRVVATDAGVVTQ
jgi:transketolase